MWSFLKDWGDACSINCFFVIWTKKFNATLFCEIFGFSLRWLRNLSFSLITSVTFFFVAKWSRLSWPNENVTIWVFHSISAYRGGWLYRGGGYKVQQVGVYKVQQVRVYKVSLFFGFGKCVFIRSIFFYFDMVSLFFRTNLYILFCENPSLWRLTLKNPEYAYFPEILKQML